MPCGITVFSDLVRVGDPAGPPERYEVQGTALECGSVTVRLEYQGATFPATLVEFEAGIWTAHFPVFDYLECGEDVELTVIADCRDTPCAEGPGQKSGTFRVKCRQDPTCPKSPDGVYAQTISLDCDENGEQQVRFSITFVPRLPAGAAGQFVVIDAAANVVASTTSDEASSGGTFSGELRLPPGHYRAMFRIGDLSGCAQSAEFDVPPCPCPAGDLVVRDRQGTVLARVPLGENLTLEDCVDGARQPLTLKVELTQQLTGVTYAWRRNNAELQGETGAQLGNVTLPANGAQVDIRVNVDRQRCGGKESTITLFACVPSTCPSYGLIEVHRGDAAGDVVFEIIEQDASGQPAPKGPRFVSGDQGVPCLPPGRYTLVVSGFDPAYHYYWYDGDGSLKGEITGGTLTYEVTQDHQADDTISIAAKQPADESSDCFRLGVPLFACDCDASVSIALFDVSLDVGERPIGQEACIEPGSYEARAEGPNPDKTVYNWKLNGRQRGATGAVMGFEAAPGFFCGDRYVMEVEARPRTNPDACVATASRAAVVCPDWAGCIECWLLRMILMVILAMVLAAVAFGICPSLAEIPWLRWLAIKLTEGGDASYVGRAAWIVWAATFSFFFTVTRIFIVIAGLAFIAGLFVAWAYWRYCKITWCYDWMILIWQALLVIGFTLAFYGSCPQCIPFQEYLLPGWLATTIGASAVVVAIGLAIMAIGLIVWAIWWRFLCKVNTCRALFELGSLAFVVNLLGAGLPAYILAPCLWTHGWVLMSFVLCAGAVLMTAAALCALYTMKARSRSLPQ